MRTIVTLSGLTLHFLTVELQHMVRWNAAPLFVFFPRSSISPWSWRRRSGEPTMASQCPTSSATYPCKKQEGAPPPRPPTSGPLSCYFWPHILQKGWRGPDVFFGQTTCDFLKVIAHTLSLTFSPRRQSKISLPSLKTKFVFMSISSFFSCLFSSCFSSSFALNPRGLAFTLTKGSIM